MKTDVETMRQEMQAAVGGWFVVRAEDCGDKVFIGVEHERHAEDHCAGQGEVVSQFYKAIGAVGLRCERQAVTHSGGGCSYYFPADAVRRATIEALIRESVGTEELGPPT